MRKDIVKNAVICLSHLKIEDTTFEIARDIVIEEYEQQKIKIEELQKDIINQDKYIDKLKNEYSKEIERLNKKIEQYENPEDMTLMFMWCNEKAKDEIKRLNNIINELEKWLLWRYENGSESISFRESFLFVIDKIKELKGDNSNE